MASVELFGAEMMAWSDLDAIGPAGAPIAHRLVDGLAPGRRVLLAGAHDTGITDRLRAAGTNVTVLLRSQPDALRIASELADKVAVQCGSLSRVQVPAGGYDAVVALGGVSRLCSVEEPSADWAESAERLLALLGTDGELWLAVENLSGAHRLVQTTIPTGDGQAWSLRRERDPTRPATLAQLHAFLAARGLHPVESYAGFGQPHLPGVLIRVPASPQEDDGSTGLMAATAATATAKAAAGRPVLRDPSLLVGDAVRRGLVAELAASWVVRVRRKPTASTPLAPVLVVADGEPSWRACWQLSGHGGNWRRTVLDGEAGTAGILRRDPSALAGPVQLGRVLEEVLVTDCVQRDLPQVRAVLQSYRKWLLAQADRDGDLSGRAVLATPGSVLVADGEHTILDPSWSARLTVAFPVALARGLRQIATILIHHGHVHPWPRDASLDQLTVLLASAAGQEIDQEVVDRAAKLEAELPQSLGPMTVESRQQLVDALARANRRAEAVEAKLAWYEQILSAREAALRRTELALRALQSTPTYQIGRLLLMAPRWVRARILRYRARLRRR